jgi:hypothetical protein
MIIKIYFYYKFIIYSNKISSFGGGDIINIKKNILIFKYLIYF